MPLVWLDALTPKQLMLFAHMARLLESRGYDVLLTCRSYDYVESLAELLGVEVRVVGGHGGTLEEKLLADARRVAELARIVARERPCALVSYPSPSAVRVAYGLSVPVVLLSDSPHSVYVHRITVPLADYLVHSEFIPREEFERYTLKAFTRLVAYRGVDELEYLKGYRPSERAVREAGLEPYRYVVVRPAEYKAAYYKGLPVPDLERVATELARSGVDVVYLPRYPEQAERMKRAPGVLVPPKALRGPDLVAYAAAVVTGGATMAREAALLGTPALYCFPRPLALNEKLAELGFPLSHASKEEEVVEWLRRVLADPQRYRREVSHLLERMEKPGEAVLRILETLCP